MSVIVVMETELYRDQVLNHFLNNFTGGILTLSVSQLATNEANLALSIEGETLNLVYFPNKYTAKVSNQFTTLDGITQELGGLIKSWDLLNDDGSMYPLDADSLAALGIGLLLQVAKGIANDIRPN